MGTALEIEMAVGSWYLPDETDLALGAAGKAFKIASKLKDLAKPLAQAQWQVWKNRRVGHELANADDIVMKVTITARRRGSVGHADDAGAGDEVATEVFYCGGRFCFIAGTPVWMADGTTKPIEQVRTGDKVLSKDEATGEVAAKQVTQTSVRSGAPVLNLNFGAETIGTTTEHPFYVEGKGFVKAGELGVGNSIATRAGPAQALNAATTATHKATVYNFTVDDFHTYFVGQSALWVHNALICVNGSFFRGGNDFTVRNIDVRIVDGLVQPTKGVSLFNQPSSFLDRFGGAYRIKQIPEELQIIQRGNDPNHFEIVPKEPMTLERYQELLNQIQVERVGG